jgi:hypothetical protein
VDDTTAVLDSCSLKTQKEGRSIGQGREEGAQNERTTFSRGLP